MSQNLNPDLAIKTTGLSKVYTRTERGVKRSIPFYALKNVNIELAKGEILGIIGNNGSGKSTLLRLLSGITKPTEGIVQINGSVASILDIGTGFHPDLSGRANTYMRGELLGMDRSEIDRLFDDIVDFSGVGDFIDSPVKHYSNGMFLRLAFSVIIYLRSDILLLDEVMTVGDMDFRQKCARKILEIANSGKTVILVSHNMRDVMDTCTLTALLKDGEIIELDTPVAVISDSYLSELAGLEGTDLEVAREKIGLTPDIPETVTLTEVHFKLLSVMTTRISESGRSSSVFYRDEEILVEITYRTEKAGFHFGIALKDILSSRLMDDSPVLYDWDFTDDFVGGFSAIWTIPKGLLNAGRFLIDVFVVNDSMKPIRTYERAIEFEVRDRNGPAKMRSVNRAPLSLDLKLQFSPLTS